MVAGCHSPLTCGNGNADGQMVMIMLMKMVVVMPLTDLSELDAMHPVICGSEDGNAIYPVT